MVFEPPVVVGEKIQFTRRNLVLDDILEGGCRHAGFPTSVAELQHVAARIEKIKLPAGEVAFRAVDDRLGEFAGLLEHFRTYVERVMQTVVLFGRPFERFLPLAEENRMTADGEAGHLRTAEASLMLQPEDFAVKPLRLVEIVDRNRPVRHAVDLKHAHGRRPQSLHYLTAEAMF